VIGPSGAVRVMVATKPVDFRKGMEGLATLVRESMGADPFSGAVYVFRAKRADLDDQNRIINGHHRVMTLLKMDIQLFIDDGVSITEARFATDDPPTLH
jgi:hypothetical protein